MAKLIAPWINFYREVEALFKNDRKVHVTFDEESYTLKLYVDDTMKAKAIEYLMPKSREFGGVTVNVEVIPANKEIENVEEAFRTAFNGTYTLSDVVVEQTPLGVFKYAVFAPEAAQYYADDISDICGNKTVLYADIAKDVFDVPGVFICSESFSPRQGSYNIGNRF